MTHTDDAASVTDIVKDFATGDTVHRVLHGVSLTIPHGQITMIVGPSGCGKTTLLSVMTGILSATAGSIRIDGRALNDLAGDRLVQFRRKTIGFVFQQFNLIPTLNAAENVAVPLIADGVPWDRAIAQAEEALERVAMADHINKLPKELSGGQLQRVAFARAIVHAPKLIVCDEPTSALDASTGQQVMEILRSAALRPDSAVVVVTHDNRIYDFADRMVHMNDGRITHITTRKKDMERDAA